MGLIKRGFDNLDGRSAEITLPSPDTPRRLLENDLELVASAATFARLSIQGRRQRRPQETPYYVGFYLLRTRPPRRGYEREPFVSIMPAWSLENFIDGREPVMPAGHTIHPRDDNKVAIIGGGALYAAEIIAAERGIRAAGQQITVPHKLFAVEATFPAELDTPHVVISDLSPPGTGTWLAAEAYNIGPNRHAHLM